MSADVLLDNILVYGLAQNDPRPPRALALMRAGGVISVQVLNEFANVARRKLNRAWPDILAALDLLQILFPAPLALTIEIHREAVSLARHEKIACYDALVVASALNAGCGRLISADLQHGRIFRRRLTILNPFIAA